MDFVIKEHLDECILLSNRLLSLQDDDALRITACLRGEQHESYQSILRIEQEKLEQLKSGLQSLQEAQMLL